MDKTLCSVGNAYRLCILADINGRIRDRTRASITSAFVISEKNENSRRVVEFCEERGKCVGNTF